MNAFLHAAYVVVTAIVWLACFFFAVDTSSGDATRIVAAVFWAGIGLGWKIMSVKEAILQQMREAEARSIARQHPSF